MGGVALVASGAGRVARHARRARASSPGVGAIVFGFAHFNYTDFTASMVPAWIPAERLFWA